MSHGEDDQEKASVQSLRNCKILTSTIILLASQCWIRQGSQDMMGVCLNLA